jgi:FkbM family methyltransferase
MLSISPGEGMARQRWRALRRVRQWLIALNVNDLIHYSIGHRWLWLPFSHDLPILRKLHPQYLGNLTRLVQAVSTKYPASPCIDIGANVGDTAALIRQTTSSPILCIEGDPLMFRILALNVAMLADVTPLCAFVGQVEQQLTGEMQRGRGTGFLRVGAGPIESQSLEVLLVDQPLFAAARFIKLDTDGFDCMILQAEYKWLAREKPVVFFEYDPATFERYRVDGLRTFSVLREAGYRRILIWNNLGDYMLALDLDNAAQLEDLHSFFMGRGSHAYADIAAFHADDFDLTETVREAELAFFQKFRLAPYKPLE